MTKERNLYIKKLKFIFIIHMGRELYKFNQYLNESGLRATRQRGIIAKTFFEAGPHISVEELYHQVVEKDRRIGLVTVYRTLKLLRGAGLAQGRQFGDNHTRYEKTPGDSHHDHLICTRCGRILEFENDTIEGLQRKVAEEVGFAVLDHKLELYGICKECRSRGKKAGGKAPPTLS